MVAETMEIDLWNEENFTEENKKEDRGQSGKNLAVLASLQASVSIIEKEICVGVLCKLILPVSLFRCQGFELSLFRLLGIQAWETLSLSKAKNGFRKVVVTCGCVAELSYGCVESGEFHVQGPKKRMGQRRRMKIQKLEG